ncbi:MAG TPA: hypothetical protein PK611_02295 [Saprospiraceae bacterium]|nr:hypothetical protein [Saprospiraceae bacterium]HRO08796.1 hypothetical protein [Saprospiraceae bacterium]HRO72480.1 hypothetical protein [Saprospiraceae bacterium]HRP41661.1 hypothetical protein [Saprospiraceae bacterium]
MCRSVLVFLAVINLLITGRAQDYNIVWKQFTVDDGLPSNECYNAVYDDLGYIWISTDRGVSRYDGYGFKNYGSDKGLDNLSVFKVKKAPDGKIWALTINKMFYIYNREYDCFLPYAYNGLINKNTPFSYKFNDFVVDDFGTLYIPYGTYITITKEGKLDTHFINTLEHLVFKYIQVGRELFLFKNTARKYSNTNNDSTVYNGRKILISIEHNNQLYSSFYNSLQTKTDPEVYRLSKDTILYSGLIERDVIFDTSSIISNTLSRNNENIYVDKYGRI